MYRLKVVLIAFFGWLPVLGLHAVSVSQLSCEDLNNPQGIGVTDPRLSWMLSSDEGNQAQTSYQILVASTVKNLNADKGDLWDSGKILSNESIQVPYAGKALDSRAQCFWKVRIWDKDGKVSGWSKPALWTMGLLELQKIGIEGRMDWPGWGCPDRLSGSHQLDLVSRR